MRQGVDLQDLAQFILERIAIGQDILGAQAAPAGVAPRWEKIDDFLYLGKLFIKGGDSQRKSALGSFSLKQGAEHQGQDAVEGMDPQFLIGPMKGRGEADPVGIFHLFEGMFDMGLGSAAEDDLLRGPGVVVRTEDTFAEADAFETFKGGRIDPEGEVQLAPGVLDFRFKDLRKVLARGNGLQPFLQGLPAIAFAPGLGLLALKELLMEFPKSGSFFRRAV